MDTDRPNKRAVGANYEQMAVDYLEQKGHCILERNYRNRYGEIDIISRDRDTIVFHEVKYRKSNAFGTPFESVNFAKQCKISRVALYYCTQKNLWDDCAFRFDVIAIYGDGRIFHTENAFPLAVHQ